MAAISGSGLYLAVFLGFVFTGVSHLVWVTSVAFGPTFWFAHIFDISGVFAGTIGGAWVYLRTRPPSDLVGPVLAADPLVVALQIAKVFEAPPPDRRRLSGNQHPDGGGL